MRSFNSFALTFITFIQACLGGGELKEYNFEMQTKCRVISSKDKGSSSFSLYENNNNPSVLSYANYFIDIAGDSGNNKYIMEYCECYTESGNCRIAGGSEKNDGITTGHSRAILEFELVEGEGKEELKSQSYEDLFNKYQKDLNLPKDYKHVPEDNELFFSNIYEFTSSNDDDDGSHHDNKEDKKVSSFSGDHAVFEKAEDTVKTDYLFPLYYTINTNHDVAKNIKIDENKIVQVGRFRIASIIECIDYFNGKEQVSKKNTYVRDGFTLTDLDCTWGNQTYQLEQIESASNSDNILKMNVAILIFLITLCYVVVSF